MPPARMMRIAETLGVLMHVCINYTFSGSVLLNKACQRLPLHSDVLASIRQPVLLIHVSFSP